MWADCSFVSSSSPSTSGSDLDCRTCRLSRAFLGQINRVGTEWRLVYRRWKSNQCSCRVLLIKKYSNGVTEWRACGRCISHSADGRYHDLTARVMALHINLFMSHIIHYLEGCMVVFCLYVAITRLVGKYFNSLYMKEAPLSEQMLPYVPAFRPEKY